MVRAATASSHTARSGPDNGRGPMRASSWGCGSVTAAAAIAVSAAISARRTRSGSCSRGPIRAWRRRWLSSARGWRLRSWCAAWAAGTCSGEAFGAGLLEVFDDPAQRAGRVVEDGQPVLVVEVDREVVAADEVGAQVMA